MGRVVCLIAASLDGFIATPSGGVDWLEPYADALAVMPTFFRTISACVMGRDTFDIAARHPWSLTGKRVIVLTHRTIRRSPHAIETFSGRVANLRATLAQEPRDVWLMGGSQVIRAFRAADMVDQWRIFTIPCSLGRGIPLFLPTTQHHTAWRHTTSRRFSSGVVENRYDRQTPRK